MKGAKPRSESLRLRAVAAEPPAGIPPSAYKQLKKSSDINYSRICRPYRFHGGNDGRRVLLIYNQGGLSYGNGNYH